MVLSGPIAFERAVTDMDRIIEYGDLAYVRTCATSCMGYTCCLYRTYKVGAAPTAEEAGWYTDLKHRVDALIDTIRPGNTTADAAIHFPPASKWGYADEAEVLTVEYGHGIGLVRLMGAAYINYNWPVINRQWSLDHPQVFEPGMVIAVESLEGEHRRGGVRIERMDRLRRGGRQGTRHAGRHHHHQCLLRDRGARPDGSRRLLKRGASAAWWPKCAPSAWTEVQACVGW